MSKQINPKQALCEPLPASEVINPEQAAARNAESKADGLSALRQPDANTGRSLGQILTILVVLLVLVNIPVNYYGVGLAHIVPDATAMVIQDGLLLKGSSPEIYVLEDHRLRLISSPEAFARYFHPDKVRLVEDNLLEQFSRGQPIRHLIKCHSSSQIYALENGQKRWVEDPPNARGAKAWDRVYRVSCDYLRQLPDGPPLPKDS